MTNEERHVVKSMFGVHAEQPRKESIGFRVLVQFFKLVQFPAKYLRQRKATAQRKIRAAERRQTHMNIVDGLTAQLKDVDARIDALIYRSVVERINLDPEIESATEHKLYLEGEIQRYS